MNLLLKRLLVVLFAVFCFAYPFGVAGIAFDVHPPFSLAWAGSAFLFLEGALLIVAAMLVYGWWRGLFTGFLIVLLSYFVEALGVGTGFPFGVYRYTDVLFPRLPGSVPLAVMFAWVLIVLGAYGWITVGIQKIRIGRIVLGAFLATLVDLEIEPVATHLQHYWQWLAPGTVNYYGVPLANFVAWFAVAGLLLVITQFLLSKPRKPGDSNIAMLAPRLLLVASAIMFGLIDLTHGYYLGVICGLLAGLILGVLSALPDRSDLTIAPAHRVKQDQQLQHNREWVKQTEQ